MNDKNNKNVEINQEVGIHRADNFQQIPNVLFQDVAAKKLNPMDICVYAVLSSFVGKNKGCWPSNPSVAKPLNRHTRTIQSSISRLVEHGHIERDEKTIHGTYFTVLLTDVKNGKAVKNPPSKPIVPRQKKPKAKKSSKKEVIDSSEELQVLEELMARERMNDYVDELEISDCGCETPQRDTLNIPPTQNDDTGTDETQTVTF